jgi:hypothetical protein
MDEEVPLNEEHQHAKNVQKSIEDIIGAKTLVKKRKKNQDDHKRELFFKIINIMEALDARNELMEVDLKLNFADYNEPYEDIIESLLVLNFGKEITNTVFFYLYERYNDDGTINELLDTNNNTIIPLDNLYDLWSLIQRLDKIIDKKYH